jgi:hypothetical protein
MKVLSMTASMSPVAQSLEVKRMEKPTNQFLGEVWVNERG